MTSQPSGGRALAKRITNAFCQGGFDLSARKNAPHAGWAGLPEVVAATAIKERGGSASDVRLALTFGAAMDRARDADRLWANVARMFERARWALQPEEIVRRGLTDLADALHQHGVSQRHSVDAAAWRMIAESLADLGRAPLVRRVVHEGDGEAGELLAAIGATTVAGTSLFPLLGGPKVGPMWVRMLAIPGGARIANISKLPVAVDVQVRKVTEYLGAAVTSSEEIERVRAPIQAAWQSDIDSGGAEGPDGLMNTAAALDPAIWFMGKWGCTFCERAGKRMPISEVCGECRFAQLDGKRALEETGRNTHDPTEPDE